MNHLDTFNEKYNEDSQKELIQNIEDITLELEDIGLSIVVYKKHLKITSYDMEFDYEDVRDVIERLVFYLKNRLIRIDIYYQHTFVKNKITKKTIPNPYWKKSGLTNFFRKNTTNIENFKLNNKIGLITIAFDDMPKSVNDFMDEILNSDQLW